MYVVELDTYRNEAGFWIKSDSDKTWESLGEFRTKADAIEYCNYVSTRVTDLRWLESAVQTIKDREEW